MRKLMTLTLASTAIIAVACSKGDTRAPTAMSDDLKRDLHLASQTQNIQISPDEVAPKAKQELAVKPKRAPQGPKVIRTKNPTVHASATPVEAAEVPTEVPQVQVLASAPAPSETPSSDSPPLARPAPVPAQNYPTAGTIPVANNGGAGGILGGIFGAVMRGGADDDHCDPRGPRRTNRPIGGTGIYGGGATIGMGGMRVPITPISRGRGR